MMRMHLLDRTGVVYLGFLGGATERRYLAELSGVGSGRFVLDATDPMADVLAPQQIVRVAIGNTTVGHWVIERIEEMLIDEEGDASGNTLAVSGRGVLALLERAMIYAQGYPGTPDTASELDFGPSFGDGWFDVLNGNVDLPFSFSFDVDDDSNGDPWANDVSTSFKCNGSMLDVVQSMSALGFDVLLETDSLQMAAVPSPAGQDRTESVIFLQGRDVQRLTRTRFSGDLANAVMAIEGAAAYQAYTDAASIALYGRLEAAIDTSDKGDQATRAEALRDLLKAPRVTMDLSVNTATYTPFLDYALGDRVQVWTQRSRDTYRIKAIEIGQSDREELGVVLRVDDRVMSYMERLHAALRRSELRPARVYGLEG